MPRLPQAGPTWHTCGAQPRPECRRPAAPARRAAARRGRRRARPDRPRPDAGARAAARAVRGTRRARALRPRRLRPAVVQPPGPPAGGDAGRASPAPRRCSTPSRRGARRGTGSTTRRLALVGFSQGTMMALYRRPAPAAADGRDPGLLGCAARCAGRCAAEARSRPPVMLIHGDADDVVPVEALFEAVEGLQAAEIPVQWIVRPGLPHSIDPDGIAPAAGSCARCWRRWRLEPDERVQEPAEPAGQAQGRVGHGEAQAVLALVGRSGGGRPSCRRSRGRRGRSGRSRRGRRRRARR